MTHVKPFKAILYNSDKIADLSQVACPPYDVISNDDQDFYYHQSPYNFIRLTLNRQDQGDDDSNNKYTRAEIFFKDWLKTEILKQDKEEAIYFYKQDFICDSKEFSRIGFFGLLQLSDASIIFPHENTHAAAKTDRMELIKRVKANLSPIFTVFSDKDKIIESVSKNFLSQNKPTLALKDAQGIRNSLWRITDREIVTQISEKMLNKQIFIADGHHRYEVACNFRKLMQEKDSTYSLQKSYNYVMTYFTALESKGLCIMPVHRVIKTNIDLSIIKEIFKINKLNSLEDLDEKLKSCSKNKTFFGLYYQGDFLLLELKDKSKSSSYLENKKCFINLDVAILDSYLLSNLLKIQKDVIIYTKEINEAKELVDNNQGGAAFMLRATNINQIRDVALSGEKMPPKSTYFYPKLLSGLTVHKFE